MYLILQFQLILSNYQQLLMVHIIVVHNTLQDGLHLELKEVQMHIINLLFRMINQRCITIVLHMLEWVELLIFKK